MPGKAKLFLAVADVYGEKLQGRVDIRLDHKNLITADRVVRDRRPPKRMKIENLVPGIYGVSVFPTLYRPVTQFANIRDVEPAKVSITLPLDADKVIDIKAPDFENLPQDLPEILKISERGG